VSPAYSKFKFYASATAVTVGIIFIFYAFIGWLPLAVETFVAAAICIVGGIMWQWFIGEPGKSGERF
jgi:hypothetical protein